MTAAFEPALVELAETVGRDGPVAVAGARTRWDVGGALEGDARIVSAPAGIYAHTPEEMTVRVGAGTTVEALHTALAEKGQRTALPERGGTVGGAVVVGENDFRMLGRGPLRHAVLQVRYVSSEGRLVCGGGPTVKNVSGFDLPRLLVGSLGTLGLLGEVTLRTNPIPEASVWLAANGADPATVHDALLAPSCVLWDGKRVWVQLEGHAADVRAETETISALAHFEEAGGPPPLPPHRWSLPPASLRTPDPAWGTFVAAVGTGLVFASRPQPARELNQAVAEIHRRLKAHFDPSGRLNPGRRPEAC